jgi:hypothetical protein
MYHPEPRRNACMVQAPAGTSISGGRTSTQSFPLPLAITRASRDGMPDIQQRSGLDQASSLGQQAPSGHRTYVGCS